MYINTPLTEKERNEKFKPWFSAEGNINQQLERYVELKRVLKYWIFAMTDNYESPRADETIKEATVLLLNLSPEVSKAIYDHIHKDD